MDPAFSHHGEAELPTYDAGGLWARSIAVSVCGVSAGPPTQSPLVYVHRELQPRVSASLSEGYSEGAIFVAKGARGVVEAVEPSTVMALGGEPVGQRLICWNLVSSSRDRIEQTKTDWSAGRIGFPLADDGEFIPLPPEPTAAHARTDVVTS